MVNAILAALGALLAPFLRMWVKDKTAPVRSKDAPVNRDAKRRWFNRVREFKSRIRPGG